MSEEIQEEDMIKLPKLPTSPNNQVYYMIYGEWMQMVEEPSIATPEHPNPQGRVLQRTVGLNEVINVHPIVYWIACQSFRYAYKIKYAVSMSKELYLWYKEVEKIMNEEQEKQEKARNKSNESDKSTTEQKGTSSLITS